MPFLSGQQKTPVYMCTIRTSRWETPPHLNVTVSYGQQYVKISVSPTEAATVDEIIA